MQVSATLIAAQQAAREARARLQVPQAPAQVQGPAFTAALEKATPGFQALPLKQAAAPAQAAPQAGASPAAQASTRLGQHINILV